MSSARLDLPESADFASHLLWMIQSSQVSDGDLGRALALEYYAEILTFSLSIFGNEDIAHQLATQA